MTTKRTRRELLKEGMLSGGALLFGLALPPACFAQRDDALANGKRLGFIDFVGEGHTETNVAYGAGLDGRLYTDLSTLTPNDPITPTDKFYVRTRASELLPDAKSWRVAVDGLVREPSFLTIEGLTDNAKPLGTHLMECAGNVQIVRFGMISVAKWAGVPISEILDNCKRKPEATRVLIDGFDRYTTESVNSVPGASWVFTLDELKSTGAFLATAMNDQPLSRDHGAPVRLVVPGWYGCTCVKWVNGITLVDDEVEATSQMREYAARTLQNGIPLLARQYQAAVIDQAAMPVRVEQWLVSGKIKYRVAGIAWGGSRPGCTLEIRFNPDEDYVEVEHFEHARNDPWSFWFHTWSPQSAGTYSIRLAVKTPAVQSRKLDYGRYVRTVEITEV